MRRIVALISTAVLSISDGSCLAHEGCGECVRLGHHWEGPQYLAEMRLQVVAMAAAAVAAVAWRLVRQAGRSASR